MKNNKVSHLLIGLVSILSVGFLIAAGVNNKQAVSICFAYQNNDASTYYKSIDGSKTGEELLSQLRTLNNAKLQHLVGYNSMERNFKYTDYASKYGSSTLSAFYSGRSTTNTNREHVWPNSHGGNKVEDDIHVIRPTIKSENEGRGNSFYVEGMNDEYYGWDPANCGNSSYRGDSARIIFYCVVADSRLSLIDSSYHKTTSEDNDNLMGKLSDLIRWNLLYPVTQRERNRNEGAEYLQGNRNPFIDHPEYVCQIWGDTNATTRDLCKKHGGDKIPLTGVSLDYSSLTIADDNQYKLTASHQPYNATNVTYSWLSTNNRVAKIDYNGNITPLSDGETTIRVTAAQDDIEFTATCLIKVQLGGDEPEPAPSGGCGGNIISTSVVLSTLALFGAGILIYKRKKEKENRN